MYDLIGDIHGHADALVQMLERLGYDRRQGHYAHPQRQAVFVGDFIDRGPQTREVLQIVRPMVEQGAALAVMGNHEYNALLFHTRDAEDPSRFLRPHTDKNVQQCLATIRQLSSEELYGYLEWFRALPMWLELGSLRVVHACWAPERIAVIERALSEHGGWTDRALQQACRDESLAEAIQIVLKGPELPLPDGCEFVDAQGRARRNVRVRWFEPAAGKSYAQYGLATEPGLPEIAVPETVADTGLYDVHEPPVFFGHYGLGGMDAVPLAANVACLDLGIVTQGLLCAYRFNGEQTLRASHFVTVQPA